MPERNRPFHSYTQAVDYLYSRLPFFQDQGARAYKPDLGNIRVLLAALGDPHIGIPYLHIGGTNGKGSSSHILASILRASGYVTGLFTSPHLKTFTERIRINGIPIAHDQVIHFVNETYDTIERIRPSFFEVTTAMAFGHFQKEKVDIAVIEVGLGGRLDSTNVITPLVSLITNIGHDHLDLLGPTLTDVAREKAGIIKSGVPVVISERQPDLENVFRQTAMACNAPIVFASDHFKVTAAPAHGEWTIASAQGNMMISTELKGQYQKKNICGVLQVISILKEKGYKITDEALKIGFSKSASSTGLKGRWQVIRQSPKVVCDTGHNREGILEILEQLKSEQFKTLRWIFGVVGDKAPEPVLSLLPKHAVYYFCAAHNPRAMDAQQLLQHALSFGLIGTAIGDVNEALQLALKESEKDDLILIGGSTYLVAEVDGL